MTSRDDQTRPYEADNVPDAAWSDAAETATADQVLPLNESPAAAIPWQEAPKKSKRPPNAMLLIGLGIAGALVLVVTIVWAMFRQPDSSTGGDPFALPSASPQPGPSSSVTGPTPVGSTPAAVADPDGAGQSCAKGFQVKGRQGFGTHAVRGSDETSCAFASKVLEAYWVQVGTPTKDSKRVTAAGTVPCSSTGGECAGDAFVMTCAAQNNEAWVTCVGGKNARVYIY